MSKKFSGPNSKQQAGRERKAAAAAEAKAQKKKQDEDARWADDGVVYDNAKAHARRKEAEAKKAAKAEWEAKKRELEAQEREAIAAAKRAPTKVSYASKNTMVTQAKAQAIAERQRRLEAEERARAREAADRKAVVDLQPVVDLENVNVILAEARAADEAKFGAENVIEAHGVDQALAVLNLAEGPDRNPERRAKALHKAFEEKMLPIVKEDHPGLRLSQYKEIMWKLWQKSEENPRNWPAEE